jgi:hypothetical protein
MKHKKKKKTRKRKGYDQNNTGMIGYKRYLRSPMKQGEHDSSF